MNPDDRTIQITLPDGSSHRISWPPQNDEDWAVLEHYFRLQNEFLHKLLRAAVSLEKKTHWGLPTQPTLKTRCVYECRDPETGEVKDLLSTEDEGDTSGVGEAAHPGTWE
jgi:hypothetical protein